MGVVESGVWCQPEPGRLRRRPATAGIALLTCCVVSPYAAISPGLRPCCCGVAPCHVGCIVLQSRHVVQVEELLHVLGIHPRPCSNDHPLPSVKTQPGVWGGDPPLSAPPPVPPLPTTCLHGRGRRGAVLYSPYVPYVPSTCFSFLVWWRPLGSDRPPRWAASRTRAPAASAGMAASVSAARAASVIANALTAIFLENRCLEREEVIKEPWQGKDLHGGATTIQHVAFLAPP